jgi:hypothetical protein
MIYIKKGYLYSGNLSYPIPIFLQDKLRVVNGKLCEYVYHELPLIDWGELPEKKEIFGYELKQHEQCFKRVYEKYSWETYRALNKELDKAIQAKNKHLAFTLVAQIDAFEHATYQRIKDGFWFFNNGFPTYITGLHYLELLFWRTDTSFGMGTKTYRDKDRRIWLVLRFCELDKDCHGLLYMKGRRDGSTSRAGVWLYWGAASNEGKIAGLQAQNETQASDIFKKHIVQPYTKLPDYLKPKDDGQENPKRSVNFSKPSIRGGAKKKTMDSSKFSDDEYLDSEISFKATLENAYDGSKLFRYLLDEAGKLENASVDELWRVHKKCLEVGTKIVGKAIVTSTVEENEKGGKEFATLWKESCYKQKNDNQRTVSGLYRFFLPAYDSYVGFIDKYGMPIIDNPTDAVQNEEGEWITVGSKEYLSKERAAIKLLGDEKALAAHKRMTPFNENDALMSNPYESLFDTDRIQAVIDKLNPAAETVRGNFIKEQSTGRIEFVETPQGRFLCSNKQVFNLIEMNNNRLINNVPMRLATGELIYRNIYEPLNCTHFVIGCDPIDFEIDKKKGRKLSDASAYVFWKYDLLDTNNSYVPIVQYLARPSVNVFYEDMLNLCKFFGCQILPEKQKSTGLEKYFFDNGYDRFIMTRPEFTMTKNTIQTDKGIAASKQVNHLLAEVIAEYLHIHCERIAFLDLLVQLLGFNIENTRDFDAVMAFGYTLLAAKKPYKPHVVDKTKLVSIF